jgi:nucleoside-triphosphatase THEP1
MSEQPPSGTPAVTGVQGSLHTIAEILRDPHPLSREVRDVLADLVDELGRMLTTGAVPPAEVAHLAESTAQLARAVHRQEAPGLLAAARNRVEAAILAAESKNPLTAGLARRLLDTLANIGI